MSSLDKVIPTALNSRHHIQKVAWSLLKVLSIFVITFKEDGLFRVIWCTMELKNKV